MKSSVLRFVFVALFAIGLSLQATAQSAAGVSVPTKAGAIKVGKIEGAVHRLTADGRSAELKLGDTLIETDTVTTSKGALVVLVFANGASVKLGGDSKLKIEEFKMDPLGEDIVLSKLESEPTVSKTSLNLAYGEMVGDVKHLNKDKGSSFNITTPVGAAGIRGTTFRIVFRPSGDGKTFTFQLSTADGKVAFEGTVQAPSNVEVPKDQELVVTAEATVDPSTGSVQVTKVEVPAATTTISAEASAQITQAVTAAITEASKNVTITTNDQQQAANTDTNTNNSTPQNTGSGNTTTEEKKSDTPSETKKSTDSTPTDNKPAANTPGATTTNPSLTPGAGG